MVLAYLLNLIHRLAVYFNFLKAKYTVKEVKQYGRDIYAITLIPESKKLKYTAGQYYYLKIDKYIGEEHPFSLLEYKENGDIVFGIKNIGLFSQRLSNLKINQTVYVEGPYGVFTKEGQNKEPKIILAGGIGFTPFYELIKGYNNDKTYLFYCNKKIDEAVNIIENKQFLGDRYFNVLDEDNTSGDTIINKRIDIEVIKKNIPDKVYKKANFFICGSPNYISAMQKILCENGIDKNRVFCEEFSL